MCFLRYVPDVMLILDFDLALPFGANSHNRKPPNIAVRSEGSHIRVDSPLTFLYGTMLETPHVGKPQITHYLRRVGLDLEPREIVTNTLDVTLE